MSTGSRFMDQENYTINSQPGPGYYNVTSKNFRTSNQKVLVIEINSQVTGGTLNHLVTRRICQVI